MKDCQLIDRKIRPLFKANHSDNTLENITKTATTTKTATGTTTTTNNSMKSVIDFDKTKRRLSEYSIQTCEGKDYNGRRSNSTESMWSNELKINPNCNKKQPRSSDNTSLISFFKMPQTSCCTNHWLSNIVDILLRVFAVILFGKLETSTAFKRKIHMEELWLYQNPRMPNIVTPTELLMAVILIPWFTSMIFYYFKKDLKDYHAANWTWTMGLCVNGLITSMFKITFGRPRPDFFYRCFPDGVMVLNNITDSSGAMDIFNCTGNIHEINEGRKSFPSGHASFAFTSFGFLTFYIGSKLHAFDARGRGQTWRLVISVLPLAVASLIAISRTCDYHHHWQDVFVGAIIGLFTSYFTYRQYYPSIFANDCEVPLPRFSGSKCRENKILYKRLPDSEDRIEETGKDSNSSSEENHSI